MLTTNSLKMSSKLPKFPEILHKRVCNSHLTFSTSKYSRICQIRYFKGIRKKWWIRRSDKLCKQVKTLIEARILYHNNSYTYIVLLFAVKYKFMTLWLNTKINSFAPSGVLHLIQHLLTFNKLFHVLSTGSWVVPCTACINSINKLWGATIHRWRSLICLNSHTYLLLRHLKRNCK